VRRYEGGRVYRTILSWEAAPCKLGHEQYLKKRAGAV
jgi:hypothetical protein